jgi:hypothetical protein
MFEEGSRIKFTEREIGGDKMDLARLTLSTFLPPLKILYKREIYDFNLFGLHLEHRLSKFHYSANELKRRYGLSYLDGGQDGGTMLKI